MDARERHAIEYDHDGEPRLYVFTPRAPSIRITWSDGDICVCRVPCARHWDADGEWIGCEGAKGNR